MKLILMSAVAAGLTIPAASIAQEAAATDSWSRGLGEDSKRGSLSDRREGVRGDSGKWNEGDVLQLAPSLRKKPGNLGLDDWANELKREKFQPQAGEECWAIFQTRQLDDNDRVWVQRIERTGKAFTIVLSEAIWRGDYRKNFTWYGVFGVNLGKLAAGEYEVKVVVEPLVFKRFDNQEDRRAGWPADAAPGGGMARESSLAFAVAK